MTSEIINEDHLSPIGLARGVVQLAPYDERWAALYEEERARLLAAVGDHILDIQHIGSTAIPGCAAKPILDIAIAVANYEAAFVCVAPIVRLGYEYVGENGIPRRHYFVKRNPVAETTHHVHINELGSPAWENPILFRDYLRAHPDAVAEYTALKRLLAERHPADRAAYTDAKGEFVAKILLLARKP